MFQALSFRAKLLLVLFVPFLTLLLVAGAGMNERFSDLRAQEQFGGVSGGLDSLGRLSDALHGEAAASSWFTTARGDTASAAELAEAQHATNQAVKEFVANRNRLLIGASDTTARIVAALDPDIAQLDVQRDRVRRLASDAAATRAYYLGFDDELLGVGERVARSLRDPAVGSSVLRAYDLRRESLERARESSVLLGLSGAGTSAELAEWVNAIGAQARYRKEFDTTATADELRAFDQGIGATPVEIATLPSTFPATRVPAAQYYDDFTNRAATLSRATASVDRVVQAESAARASTGRQQAWLYGIYVVLAMLVTLGLTWYVVGAVLRPLRRLTAAARQMSQHQLPQLIESLRKGGDMTFVEPTPIAVASEDEIGELARAFSDVETVTVSVAKEQSQLLRRGMGELFVNLARRNQSLIERQLALLDDLEHGEQDPAALEQLFRLDHMATRMRRNAESLLVLSGAEQPRLGQEPVNLLDVVRAAAAEIADFPRVDLTGVDAAVSVSGRAVGDVAHLLAELLENATAFSSPESPVLVTGAPTAAGFVLAISDQGIGMPVERLGEANHLLAHPPVVGLALSRALGLHVVGLLAARHGIGVELRTGTPVGVIALILLPTAILVAPAATGPANPVVEGVAWRPPDEPPVEEWRREGMAPDGARVDGATRADDLADPPAPDLPHASPADVPYDPPPAGQEAPLPSRVPGRNLSHHPSNPGEVDPPEADPMRPQKVHEMLTRHAHGIRRGRSESDGTEQDPTP